MQSLPIGPDRTTFFKSCLRRLGIAASKGYETLKSQCREEAQVICKQYPQVPIKGEADFPDELPPVQAYSSSIFPSEWSSEYSRALVM